MRRSVVAVLVAGALILVLGVAAVLVVTLRSGHDDTNGAATDAHVHLDEHRSSDPTSVAEAALAAMFSWQPATDTSPAAAVTRARSWLGGQLAADAAQPPATDVRPLPQWAGWRESGDIVSATAQSGKAITSSDTRQVLEVALTQTVLHRDGSTTPYSAYQIRAVVESTTDGWRLTEYNLSPT